MLATVFAGVVLLAIAQDLVHKELVGIDFHTYLAAAIVGMGRGRSHIYDQGPVDAVQRSLDPHVWTQQFLSTPPVALLVSPFAAVSYRIATSRGPSSRLRRWRAPSPGRRDTAVSRDGSRWPRRSCRGG